MVMVLSKGLNFYNDKIQNGLLKVNNLMVKKQREKTIKNVLLIVFQEIRV